MKDIFKYLDTEATERDLRNGVADEYGVLYSEDGAYLLECRNRELKHYVVKDGCKIICDKAFFNHTPFSCELESIVIPEGLIAIGNASFLACGKLRNNVLPDSLRYIGESAFELCKSLEKITLPSGLVSTGGNPFADSGIRRVISKSPHFKVVDDCLMNDDTMVAWLSDRKRCAIPVGTKEIGNEVFNGGSNIHELLLPDGLEKIGSNAFQGCTLQRLVIPRNVKIIGDNPFAFASVKTLEVASPHFTYKNGFLISDKGVLVAYMGTAVDVVIPDTICEVGAGAFYNRKDIQRIIMPSCLKVIRHHAFANCENIAELVVPESVNKIEQGAFEGCRSLRTTKLPQGLTFIDDSLFSHSGIEELSIPDGVTYIGKQAFFFCNNLQHISIPTSVREIDNYAFYACEKLREISVPNGNVALGHNVFDICHTLKKISYNKVKKT